MKERLNQISGLTLYGAGGHCKVVMDILECMGEKIDFVVDDNPPDSSFRLVPCKLPDGCFDRVIITIGDCNIRKDISRKIKVNRYLTALHPSAIISPHCFVGDGTVIMPGVIINSDVIIGKHCIINTKSSVDHECRVADFVHIAPGATLSGNVDIGECSWIGVGTCVKQGIKIGSNCIIGAGSVVVRNIPDNVIAYGNPCKVIKQNKLN